LVRPTICVNTKSVNYFSLKMKDAHFVWVTKYRYHMFKGDIALRVKELSFIP